METRNSFEHYKSGDEKVSNIVKVAMKKVSIIIKWRRGIVSNIIKVAMKIVSNIIKWRRGIVSNIIKVAMKIVWNIIKVAMK